MQQKQRWMEGWIVLKNYTNEEATENKWAILLNWSDFLLQILHSHGETLNF